MKSLPNPKCFGAQSQVFTLAPSPYYCTSNAIIILGDSMPRLLLTFKDAETVVDTIEIPPLITRMLDRDLL